MSRDLSRMHPALFIDEIIRHIFYFCYEDTRTTLVSAARCCSLWKPLALDYVWAQLPSVMPLLQLIPSIVIINGVYTLERPLNRAELALFHDYADRIKHISHKRLIEVDDSVLSIFENHQPNPNIKNASILSRLRTAKFSSVSHTQLSLLLSSSPQLEQLDFDLGFKTISSISNERVCNILINASTFSPCLSKLRVRGLASDQLNEVISSLSGLQFLSLRLGNSLSSSTVLPILSFPRLTELEIHMGHIHTDAFEDQFYAHDNSTFPVLNKLSIRATSKTVEFILRHLQTNTLTFLYLELEDTVITLNTWTSIFGLMCRKFADTLQHLKIEYFNDNTHLDSNSRTDGINSDSSPTQASPFSFEHLQMLRRLRCLRHLIIDMNIPPDLCDENFEELGKWWPNLESLDLGFVFDMDSIDVPRTTAAALAVIAKSFPRLRSLVIPLNMKNDLPSGNLPQHNILESLTFGCATALTHTPFSLAKYLHEIFPSLQCVLGPTCQDPIWQDIQGELCHLQDP